VASLEEWLTQNSTDALRDRQADVVRRYSSAIDFEQLVAAAVKALGERMEIQDPTEMQVAHAILRKALGGVLDHWQARDSANVALLPVRLVEAIREEVGHAFKNPKVYSGIEKILRDWAEQDEVQLEAQVQQFRTRFSTVITDSVIPGTIDREVELLVTVAYPGEQNDDVETRLREALEKQERLGQFLKRIPPTFVPRSAGDALVISVSLIGQGLLDIPDGAASLFTWVQSAFSPHPDDRLAWRQREGYRDLVDFMDAHSRARFIQRLLATAWNGQLTAVRSDNGKVLNGEPAGTFKELVLRFGAADAPGFTIPMTDMPFERHLAPLLDAYLREVSRQYVMDPENISEILRQLALSVPAGFVERRMPSTEVLAQRPLFFEFVEELHEQGSAARERAWFEQLRKDLDGRTNARRRNQINEYHDFWAVDVRSALELSFTTTGYGSFREVIDDLRPSGDSGTGR